MTQQLMKPVDGLWWPVLVTQTATGCRSCATGLRSRRLQQGRATGRPGNERQWKASVASARREAETEVPAADDTRAFKGLELNHLQARPGPSCGPSKLGPKQLWAYGLWTSVGRWKGAGILHQSTEAKGITHGGLC